MDRRQFLETAICGAALVGTPAFARTQIDGQATRTSAEVVRLNWTAQKLPVTVMMSTDADAPRRAMRVVKTRLRAEPVDLAAPVSPRPYFLVSTSDGAQVRVAERLLPLQGGRNFRDLGGYRAVDGRQVRWGRLYRSGVMSGLTPADMRYLSDLDVKVICDFRSTQERSSEPNPFLKAQGGPSVVATDYDMTGLQGIQNARTREAAIDAFAAGYVQFAELLAPQYADMFARLKRQETPLAFNCSAGKDRAGLGAAMILSVLGVPRETVIADYALTQVYTPPSMYMKHMAASGTTAGMTPEQAAAFARMPREVLEVMLGSDPEVMRRALATIDQKFGGPIGLAKARYGLTGADVDRLRSTHLI